MPSLEPLLIAADTAWQQAEPDRARNLYRRALEQAPGNPIALRRLAWLEDARGDIAAAIALLKRLISLHPSDARAHQDLGLCHQKLGRPHEALEAFRQATQADANYAPAFCNLGLALEEIDDHTGAIAALQRAADLKPDSTFIAYHLAALGGASPPPICPPDYLTRLFDAYADRFDAHLFDKLGYRGPQLLAEIVANHGPPKPWNILDIGCGTGMTAVPFRSIAKQIVGVDLSVGMIQIAARRTTPDGTKVYDRLEQSDVLAALRERSSSIDLILSADVFIYFGDLHAVLRASRAALRPGGLLAFTIETIPGPEDFSLRPTRRFAQSNAYIAKLATALNFIPLDQHAATLRQGENGNPVAGEVYLLQRPA